jgi:hypothetical protein
MTTNEADATTGETGETLAETDESRSVPPTSASEMGEREMLCPVCSAPMPDLKGGKAAICSVCGFKDSCCF